MDDLTDLLTRACATVPSDVDVSAAREFQAYGEPGLAVDALAGLDTGWQPPPAWWDLLIGAADLMRMGPTARWCRWRRWESLHGVLRASLELTAGGPIPGRLFWDIAVRTPVRPASGSNSPRRWGPARPAPSGWRRSPRPTGVICVRATGSGSTTARTSKAPPRSSRPAGVRRPATVL